MKRSPVQLALTFCLSRVCCRSFHSAQSDKPSKIHTYYIAADEVEWDYAPDGIDKMMGMGFDGWGKMFMERGPHSIGRVYRKAVYREYTDASFSTLKQRAPEWQHLGILGPVLRAEVGDTIKVIFRNNATRPYSMHPHGVFYAKESEGSVYERRLDGRRRRQIPSFPRDRLTPMFGRCRIEPVPDRPMAVRSSGSYHSHVDEQRDVNSGLVGPIIITARGMSGSRWPPQGCGPRIRQPVSCLQRKRQLVSRPQYSDIHIRSKRGRQAGRQARWIRTVHFPLSVPASAVPTCARPSTATCMATGRYDHEERRTCSVVSRFSGRCRRWPYSALARKQRHLPWASHRRRAARAGGNGNSRHGPRQSGYLDVPLPRR